MELFENFKTIEEKEMFAQVNPIEEEVFAKGLITDRIGREYYVDYGASFFSRISIHTYRYGNTFNKAVPNTIRVLIEGGEHSQGEEILDTYYKPSEAWLTNTSIRGRPFKANQIAYLLRDGGLVRETQVIYDNIRLQMRFFEDFLKIRKYGTTGMNTLNGMIQQKLLPQELATNITADTPVEIAALLVGILQDQQISGGGDDSVDRVTLEEIYKRVREPTSPQAGHDSVAYAKQVLGDQVSRRAKALAAVHLEMVRLALEFPLSERQRYDRYKDIPLGQQPVILHCIESQSYILIAEKQSQEFLDRICKLEVNS